MFLFFIKKSFLHNHFWYIIDLFFTNNYHLIYINVFIVLIYLKKKIFIFFLNKKFIIFNNIGLINGLFKVHPPLFFMLFLSHILIKPNHSKFSSLLLVITLGGIWALQELSWGGWWNWDSLELTILVWVIGSVVLLHLNWKFSSKLISSLNLYALYTINLKWSFNWSIHSFINFFFFKKKITLLLPLYFYYLFVASYVQTLYLFNYSFFKILIIFSFFLFIFFKQSSLHIKSVLIVIILYAINLWNMYMCTFSTNIETLRLAHCGLWSKVNELTVFLENQNFSFFKFKVRLCQNLSIGSSSFQFFSPWPVLLFFKIKLLLFKFKN